MKLLLRCIRSDFFKLRHTSFYTAHVMIPIAMAGGFLLYYRCSAWDAFSKIQAFYQVMGMGYPFLIGVFCAIIAEQEALAGGYQRMLAVSDRVVSFSSKLLVLILSDIVSVLLTSMLFGTGFSLGTGQQHIGFSFYLTGAGVMLGANLFLYVGHLFLALRFSKGVTIGIGIAESLLAALCLTGLGDVVWVYIPSAWAGRMVSCLLYGYRYGYADAFPAFWQRDADFPDMGGCTAVGTAVFAAGCELILAAVICGIATAVSFAAYEIWACLWDGRSGNE